jgi:DNA-directed RNA polymerase subunit H (RpoH/RPB5)
MTSAARQLIDSFEALSNDEKHQVVTQLLRRLTDLPHFSPSDEDLTHAADLVFQEYDHREAED